MRRYIMMKNDDSDSKYVVANIDKYESAMEDMLSNHPKIIIPIGAGDEGDVARR